MLPACDRMASLFLQTLLHLQMILVQTADAEPPEQLAPGSQRPESSDGVTPAMRSARQRLFASSRKDMQVDPKLLANVTLDLANLAQVSSPEDARMQELLEEAWHISCSDAVFAGKCRVLQRNWPGLCELCLTLELHGHCLRFSMQKEA